MADVAGIERVVGIDLGTTNSLVAFMQGGTPVVTLIHHGGHVVPKEGPELIVKFFKKVTEK